MHTTPCRTTKEVSHGNILQKLYKLSHVPDIAHFAPNLRAILKVFGGAIIKQSYCSVTPIPREALIDLPVNFEGCGLGQQTKTCTLTQAAQMPCQQPQQSARDDREEFFLSCKEIETVHQS